MRVFAEEAQQVSLVRRHELLREQPAEQARENTKRQEEAWPACDPTLAIQCDAAARTAENGSGANGGGGAIWGETSDITKADRDAGH